VINRDIKSPRFIALTKSNPRNIDKRTGLSCDSYAVSLRAFAFPSGYRLRGTMQSPQEDSWCCPMKSWLLVLYYATRSLPEIRGGGGKTGHIYPKMGNSCTTASDQNFQEIFTNIWVHGTSHNADYEYMGPWHQSQC